MSKTYAEKLKHPKWQKKRLEIMGRDEFTCRHCRAKDKTLNVHHVYYKKGAMPWDYEDELLMTLCEDCHNDIEESNKKLLLLSSVDKATHGKITRMAKVYRDDIYTDACEVFGLAFGVYELALLWDSFKAQDGILCVTDEARLKFKSTVVDVVMQLGSLAEKVKCSTNE